MIWFVIYVEHSLISDCSQHKKPAIEIYHQARPAETREILTWKLWQLHGSLVSYIELRCVAVYFFELPDRSLIAARCRRGREYGEYKYIGIHRTFAVGPMSTPPCTHSSWSKTRERRQKSLKPTTQAGPSARETKRVGIESFDVGIMCQRHENF